MALRRWHLLSALVALSAALLRPRALAGRRRYVSSSARDRRDDAARERDDMQKILDVAALNAALQRSDEAVRLEQLRSLNDAFRSTDSTEARSEDEMPLNTASWTYYPGMREVVHVHRPAFVYMIEEAVLRGGGRYVHALEGSDVGVVVEVVAVKRDELRGSIFILVHATRRVRFQRGDRGLVMWCATQPLLDCEEASAADANAWARLDDVYAPSETWLRDGNVQRLAPDFADAAMGAPQPAEAHADDDALRQAEAEVWAEVDTLVGLIRRSRTTGEYDLPPWLLALRAPPASYPAWRRALRLSFSLDALLDLDRAGERQAWIECTSTVARLGLARDRLTAQRAALAAALALEAIRRRPFGASPPETPKVQRPPS
ncbi:hypothetical protein M885DRAFT_610195 [Pelagophyceae sp. CCMP2097]|nr:hypothetical protein M885DRAFT_610195 [Pelagophyceae sp. CCMP2097]